MMNKYNKSKKQTNFCKNRGEKRSKFAFFGKVLILRKSLYFRKIKMRKKIWILLLSSLCFIGIGYALPAVWPTTETILTEDSQQIITPPEENAIREGTHNIIQSSDSANKIENLLETQPIASQDDATMRTIKLIHRIINYALSLVSVIALVVLIYAGIQMTTAAGDDKKYQAGKSTLKKITIGIVGIGISWLIISLIFWFLATITKTSL